MVNITSVIVFVIVSALAIIGLRTYDVYNQREIGANRVIKIIEDANEKTIKTINRVRSKSRDGGVLRKIDPHYK